VSARRQVLVIGAHGVIGRAVAELLDGERDRDVVTLARRGPLTSLAGERTVGAQHVAVDLLDAAATRTALRDARDVSHVVFAAYVERPTMAETVAPNVAMLANALDALASAGAPLERVLLIGGGKSYGAHLGPYKTPARESDPRLPGPIFYNDQEDLLRARAAAGGFAWTVLRPDVVIGPSVGSPMNILTGLAVYAAISKAEGVPLRFPGSPGAWTALHQITDAGLLARGVRWALDSPAAAGEIFNLTNGDTFRWQHVWDEVAGVFELPTATPQPMPLAEQMADREPLWDRLVAEHGLRTTPWAQIVSWPFTEAIWRTDHDLVQSTVKIRKAGFAGCEDSHTSLVSGLRRLRALRFVP
jgi:nucleoside-diphosphate-sugar epimerase